MGFSYVYILIKQNNIPKEKGSFGCRLKHKNEIKI